jgi:hypothetical protein
MSRPTQGAALLTVVLITLALFAVGHGLLAIALAELSASRAGARHLEARTAAGSAIHRVLKAPGAAWVDSVAARGDREVGVWSVGGAQAAARAWRLSPETWWLEGRGSVGVATNRTARLVWALDPLTRVLALDAVMSVAVGAPISIEGIVDAGVMASIESPLLPGDCDPWLGDFVAHYGAHPLAATGVMAAGDTAPRLGSLDLEDLLATATIRLTGSGTPTPADAGGACTEAEPWSWGDPEHRWRPCGDQLVLRGAVGDLVMQGGSGQGVLVVDGNLIVGSGARFYGLALVRGALRVEGGARLVGMAVAAGGAHVEPGSQVKGSACWVARALRARRPDLGSFRLVAGVGSLGSF